MFEYLEPVTICELDDGTRVEYDACSERADAYAGTHELIGYGFVYSVNGVLQNLTYHTPLYFYRRIVPHA